MLGNNIQALRKSQGLTQLELAIKLNVVRQTISKWEQGLSVPDADLLIDLAQALNTSVSSLLGEITPTSEANNITTLANKLEVINFQLAQKNERRRLTFHRSFIGMCCALGALTIILFLYQSAYLTWDYSDPETAVLTTLAHSGEWIFTRLVPFALIGCILGVYLTRKRP